MDTLRSLLKVFLLLVFLVVLGLSAVLGFRGYRNLTEQKVKLSAKDAEIEKLGQSQMNLSKSVNEAEENAKKLLAENEQLKKAQEDIEKQKSVILRQVRSSVDSFENFRVQANDEIAKLKKVVDVLESQRKSLQAQLDTSLNQSDSDKQNLESQLAKISEQLEKQKSAQEQLFISNQKKSRSALVMDAAKLHYNAGNFYFRNRDFENAASEYKKALFYEPDDAQANYNMAVLSDEILGDRMTAITHYRRYLKLRSGAKDETKIRSRILDLEIGERVEPTPQTKQKKQMPAFKTGEDPFAGVVIAEDKK